MFPGETGFISELQPSKELLALATRWPQRASNTLTSGLNRRQAMTGVDEPDEEGSGTLHSDECSQEGIGAWSYRFLAPAVS